MGNGVKGRMEPAVLLLIVLVLLLAAGAWGAARQGGEEGPTGSGPGVDPRAARLQGHVQVLAGEIGERNLWQVEALERSSRYIEAELQKAGCSVRSRSYLSRGHRVRNLEAQIPGVDFPEEIVVIGAHYDSVFGSPGANDNASGVAALLELGRHFCSERPARTLRLVAFVNEEPPFFQSAEMGSLVYARQARANGERITAMVSLETIGYYSQEPGSQHFPLPLLRLLYPERGEFVAFVSDLGSWRLLRRALAAFRSSGSYPARGLVAPRWVTGVGWSDQWSFWQSGYRAIMVTDTALFRYPHYHSEEDTPDKLDYAALAKVTEGLVTMVNGLCRE